MYLDVNSPSHSLNPETLKHRCSPCSMALGLWWSLILPLTVRTPQDEHNKQGLFSGVIARITWNQLKLEKGGLRRNLALKPLKGEDLASFLQGRMSGNQQLKQLLVCHLQKLLRDVIPAGGYFSLAKVFHLSHGTTQYFVHQGTDPEWTYRRSRRRTIKQGI